MLSTVFVPFVAGFGLGASLIIAIGAQNAFVLRQGLLRAHVLPIVLICSFSDAVLIAAGVAGFAALTQAAPWIEPAFTYGGAAFLLWYAARSFWSAWKGGEALEAAENRKSSLKTAILTCLALTFLNPHVYLDTLVLVGSISAQYERPWVFGAGVTASSFFFFFLLGYGARLLAPLFARARSWQVLDLIMGIVMTVIAVKLLLG